MGKGKSGAYIVVDRPPAHEPEMPDGFGGSLRLHGPQYLGIDLFGRGRATIFSTGSIAKAHQRQKAKTGAKNGFRAAGGCADTMQKKLPFGNRRVFLGE